MYLDFVLCCSHTDNIFHCLLISAFMWELFTFLVPPMKCHSLPFLCIFISASAKLLSYLAKDNL